MMQLTAQQQAIVDHNHGPALVFAVAGAGKTTAIEHRIVRLVQQQVFAAPRILATTFNTKNASELRSRLARWPGCDTVAVSTLNALGHLIINEAFKMGSLPTLQKQAFTLINGATELIFNKTKSLAYERRLSFVDELEALDRDDFLTYVSKCKGNLAYADLSTLALPSALAKLATQAEPPKNLPWYLDLYKLYEQTRQELGLFTFDDQLLIGWQLLASNVAIRTLFQQRYDCLLVDEFQDVNKAQAEMLDLLAAPHRNYMAVGDDDQTIYEWRGADPTYILSFAERYQAKVYLMTENFRCMASQIVLANAVIRQNKERRPKQLQLTQGFAGSTTLDSHDSVEQMAAALVQRIQQLQKGAVSLKEMVVLVRIYAQTPPIEQQLILHQIPYEVVGSVPFTLRPEVQTLIAYCRLAYLEKLRQVGSELPPAHQEQWRDCWNQVYWQPRRFLKKEVAKKIAESCFHFNRTLADMLTAHAIQMPSPAAGKLTAFAADLTWLITAFPGGERAHLPAADILQELEKRLGYMEYLGKSSGASETGADRAATIAAFIRFARNQGPLLEFLQGVKKLSEQHEALAQQEEKLVLTTIFRSKGLEWPHVFLPNCNDQVFPYKLSHSGEEERRLLYVALTRARHALYLYALKEEPLSPFLSDANYANVLAAIEAIGAAAHKPPAEWSDRDLRAIAIHAARLGLERYFCHWWKVSSSDKVAAARLVSGCYQTIAARGLLEQVGVSETHRQFWQAMLPAGVTPLPLREPGLERWLDEVERSLKPRKVNPLTRFLKRTAPQPAASQPSDAQSVPAPVATLPTRWQRGERVRHPQHGIGQITTVSSMTGEIWVQFDGAVVPRTVKGQELERV